MESRQDLLSMAGCIFLIAVSSYLVHLQSQGGHHRKTGVSIERRQREKYRQRALDYKADIATRASMRRMEEDPTLYAKQISELENPQLTQDFDHSVVNRRSDDAPSASSPSEIRGNEGEVAFFRLLKPFIEAHLDNAQQVEKITATAAQTTLYLIQQRAIRGWIDNYSVQKDMQDAIDDYLYEVIREEYKIDLTPDEMDEILEKSLQLAKQHPNLVQSRMFIFDQAPKQAVTKRHQRQSELL